MIIFLLLPFQLLYGQFIQQPLFKDTVKSLRIGDRVPEVLLQKILGQGVITSQSLRAYDGQLLLIDFWATNCSGCIQSLPKLDSLQQLFGNQIHVLLSTYEKEQAVRTFMARNPIAKKLLLTTVVEDNELGAYFEHRSIPHVVWIWKGSVVAITGTEYINGSNIRAVLQGQPVHWPVKNELTLYDYEQPLLQAINNRDFTHNRLQYSALLGYQDGVASRVGITVDTVQKTRRAYLINVPIVNAYFLLYMRTMDIFQLQRPHLFLTPNQLIVEGAPRSDFWFERAVSGYKAAWEREHDISLEVVVADTGQNDTAMYRFMIGELNRLLGVEGGFERRNMECLVLKKVQGDRQRKPETATNEAANALAVLTNQGTDAGNLVYHMNLQAGNPPVFDDSGYNGKLHLDTTEWTDVVQLTKLLRPFGLTLVRQQRKVDLLVIRKHP